MDLYRHTVSETAHIRVSIWLAAHVYLVAVVCHVFDSVYH